MRNALAIVCAFALVTGGAIANDDDMTVRAQNLIDKTKVTSLTGKDFQPYQLKASFQLFGLADGDKDGTLVRDWVSPSKWREDITAGGYHFTVARDGDKWWSTPQPFEPLRIEQLRRALGRLEIQPRAAEDQLKIEGLKETKIDGRPVTCIIEKDKNNKDKTCVETDSGKILRREDENTRIDYADYEPFRDRVIARQRTLTFEGKQALVLKIDSISDATTFDQAEFQMPQNAFADNICEKDFSYPRAVSTVDPVWPLNIDRHLHEATVILGAVLLSDGSIGNLLTIRSEGPFDKAATDAVRKWKFEPATCQGTPMEYRIHIEVSFRR